MRLRTSIGVVSARSWGASFTFGGFFTYLIVKTLTSHQQKMAELMRKQNNDSGLEDEIRGLRYQVSILQDKVNDMSNTKDGNGNVLPLAPAPLIGENERLRGSG